MPSTHTALIYHLVFSTKNREAWFVAEFLSKLHNYMGGAIRGLDGHSFAVGGIADHIHMLVGLKPTHTLSDVMRELKACSSKWVKEQLRMKSFAWQEGYGGFTVSPPDLEKVRKYVLNQESHHRKTTFKEEYLAMLERGMIQYDDRYLW
ncbi:MAG: IS200/IS605 family transposase [Verrucomicrobiae bacterium]|nr:IS200/IS605 family transposase [Verrucomicrobiae bacterium]NNJ85533.1 IS200/IS605 family transposase [Akkermansiaceae bacterium]